MLLKLQLHAAGICDGHTMAAPCVPGCVQHRLQYPPVVPCRQLPHLVRLAAGRSSSTSSPPRLRLTCCLGVREEAALLSAAGRRLGVREDALAAVLLIALLLPWLFTAMRRSPAAYKATGYRLASKGRPHAKQ